MRAAPTRRPGPQEEFLLQGSPRLFAFVDGLTPSAEGVLTGGSLRLTRTPPAASALLAYFLRDSAKPVTEANVEGMVRYGLLRGNVQEFLLSVMSGVFQPAIMGNKAWPDSLRKDLNGQLHKLMASLTERVHGGRGHTVLYVPPLEVVDPVLAAGEKDLVRGRNSVSRRVSGCRIPLPRVSKYASIARTKSSPTRTRTP